MVLNILGGSIATLSYHYPRYNVMDAECFSSQATPIDCHNKTIDMFLLDHYTDMLSEE